MKRGAHSGNRRPRGRLRRPFRLDWIGLPEYPGIVLFFLSVALSYHLFDVLLFEITKYSDYEALAAEPLKAALTGLLAAWISVTLVRRFRATDPGTVLSRLSITLLPGVLFIFAPFRYAQMCRWTDWCQYWSDLFLVAGIGLCVLAGLWA